MDEPEIPSISAEVQAAFAPIMKALAGARRSSAKSKTWSQSGLAINIRRSGKPVPALVVAIVPGTTPAGRTRWKRSSASRSP